MPADTNVQTLIINKMTQAQYDALTTKDPAQVYVITDAESGGGASTAADVSYDSTGNHILTGSNLQQVGGQVDTALTDISMMVGKVPYSSFNPEDPNSPQDWQAKISFALPADAVDGTYFCFTKSLNQSPGYGTWYIEFTIKDGEFTNEYGANTATFVPGVVSPANYSGWVGEAANSLAGGIENGTIILTGQMRGPLTTAYYNEPFPTTWLKVSPLYRKTTLEKVAEPQLFSGAIPLGVSFTIGNPYATNVQEVLTQSSSQISVNSEESLVLPLYPQQAGEGGYNASYCTKIISLWLNANNYFFAELVSRDRWIWKVLAAKGVFTNLEASIWGATETELVLVLTGFGAVDNIFTSVGVYPLRYKSPTLTFYTALNPGDPSTKRVLTPETVEDSDAGLRGDYCCRYGVVAWPNGRPTIGAGNTVNVPAGLVLNIPGTVANPASNLITMSSAQTVTLTKTTNSLLVYVQGLDELQQCDKICFSSTMPEDDESTCQLWWNGLEMKFRSNDQGNVWIAVRAGILGELIYTDGSLTRINPVGWYHYVPETTAS